MNTPTVTAQPSSRRSAVDVPKRTRAAAFAVCLLAAGCSASIDPMAIADAQAAALVKTVLVNDPGLGGQTIEVRVVRGVALLSGRIRTQAEVDPAPGSR
jgi:osmotically-inducible protein OsmY